VSWFKAGGESFQKVDSFAAAATGWTAGNGFGGSWTMEGMEGLCGG